MTAETGMTDGRKLKAITRINALASNAVDLVAGNARTKTDTDTLLLALQAFKDNKLAAVVHKSKRTLTDENLLTALSLPIVNLQIPPEDKKYLSKRGVRYLGELYYVFFDPRSRPSRERGEKIFAALAANLKVPKKLDPLAIGWTPPYWDEAHVAELNRSVLSCFGNYDRQSRNNFWSRRGLSPRNKTMARRLHVAGIHYMGSYLQRNRGLAVSGGKNNAWSTGNLTHTQRTLQNSRSGLWAAALVPASWKAPEGAPADWIEEEKVIEVEWEAWQKEREQATARREAEDRELRRQEIMAKAERPEPPSHDPVFTIGPRFRCGDQDFTMEQIAFLFTNCDDLGFSVRVSNNLRNMDIRLVWQLVIKTELELLRSKNFGRKSMREIKDTLSEHSLTLGMVLAQVEAVKTLADQP